MRHEIFAQAPFLLFRPWVARYNGASVIAASAAKMAGKRDKLRKNARIE
jgi:hypothetical protein